MITCIYCKFFFFNKEIMVFQCLSSVMSFLPGLGRPIRKLISIVMKMFHLRKHVLEMPNICVIEIVLSSSLPWMNSRTSKIFHIKAWRVYIIKVIQIEYLIHTMMTLIEINVLLRINVYFLLTIQVRDIGHFPLFQSHRITLIAGLVNNGAKCMSINLFSLIVRSG